MLKNDKCEHCGRQLTQLEETFCDMCIQETLHKLSEKGLVNIKRKKDGKESYAITKKGLDAVEDDKNGRKWS